MMINLVNKIVLDIFSLIRIVLVGFGGYFLRIKNVFMFYDICLLNNKIFKVVDVVIKYIYVYYNIYKLY